MIKQLLELVLNAEKKAISLVIVPMRIQDLLAVKFEIELIEEMTKKKHLFVLNAVKKDIWLVIAPMKILDLPAGVERKKARRGSMIVLVSIVVKLVIWLEIVLTKIQELKEVELPIDFQIETMIVLASNVANKDI